MMYADTKTNKVLNIGAGFLPLVASDLGVEEVINYDPLQYQKAKGDITNQTYEDALKYFRTVIRFKELIAPYAEVQYYTNRDEVDGKYRDGTVDLVISISPYGFTLIDEWVDAKLKYNGYILVAANHSNEWANNDEKLYSRTLDKDRYYKPTNLTGTWLGSMRKVILQKYQSYTSKIEKDTVLDTIILIQKIT